MLGLGSARAVFQSRPSRPRILISNQPAKRRAGVSRNRTKTGTGNLGSRHPAVEFPRLGLGERTRESESGRRRSFLDPRRAVLQLSSMRAPDELHRAVRLQSSNPRRWRVVMGQWRHLLYLLVRSLRHLRQSMAVHMRNRSRMTDRKILRVFGRITRGRLAPSYAIFLAPPPPRQPSSQIDKLCQSLHPSV